MKLRQPKYIIAFCFILLGIGIVVATSLPKSFQYYVTVDELNAREREFMGKEFKVAGKVEEGSHRGDKAALDHQFRVVNAGQVVAVSYRGYLPDTFKEGAEVVVTGTLKEPGYVMASDVLAKCASRYEEKLTPGYTNVPKQGT